MAKLLSASIAFQKFPTSVQTPRRYSQLLRAIVSPSSFRRNASTRASSSPPSSAYVHLPFCHKRCHYCDFAVIALGSAFRSDSVPLIDEYIGLLLREIASIKPPPSLSSPLETIFFGGGTPSLVSPKSISFILQALDNSFGISDNAEISMEMDPGTFDSKKLKDFMNLGVNRVSLGVQAFQEELLQACGRSHGVNEVYKAIDDVINSGVNNWSLDLISSLPHQSADMWEESLKITVEKAQPKHISVYDLQIEKGTKFGNLYNPGEFPLPSETQSAEFYKTASSLLSSHGYSHYEISSYAKPGFECKHNNAYWLNKSFYGFGLSAASFVEGVRFTRPRKMKEYAEFVERLEKGDVGTTCGGDNAADDAMDVVMLSLRTAAGIDVGLFIERFGGVAFGEILGIWKPYIESGHVICLGEDRRVVGVEDGGIRDLRFVRLSDPEGFLLSNELISLAFASISP